MATPDLEAFEFLQQKLIAQWSTISAPTEEAKTMVVVPSLSVDIPLELAGVVPAYEERFLFLLLLLRQPRARVLFVTSMPVAPRIVDYYLGLVPGLDSDDTRRRLTMLTVGDPSPEPLSAKLLGRPRMLERIRASIPDLEVAHLVPFNTTKLEQELTVRLGIPMYAASPDFAHLGSKTGSRRLFEEAGVPHPRGTGDIHSVDQAIAAIQALRSETPSLKSVMVKLDHGVGGLSNGRVDISDTASPGDIRARLRRVELEDADSTADHFFSSLNKKGGVVEERIEGAGIVSPSVQLRISPAGEIELLSTHDQLLGGATGQAFLGARFPADSAYSKTIAGHARKVAGRLAEQGVIGRFAVDFVAVPRDRGWDTYAIEINLRKGGTTHPFLTLQFLAGGSYEEAAALYRTESGLVRHYVATDRLEAPEYRCLTPDDLLDLTKQEGLRWDHAAAKGVVFHMMSAIAVAGRAGLTAIGETPEEADELHERVVAAMDAASGRT